ncbi:MAG: phosphoesterase, partial [Acidobacteria bacterium]|nr:phosphoesterase [Acidobacteriota bacterium]
MKFVFTRLTVSVCCLLLSLLSLAPCAFAQTTDEENVALRWNQVALQAVRNTRLGPPMVARALAVTHTAMFDAWAPYDDVAVGTRLGATLRRPTDERTAE